MEQEAQDLSETLLKIYVKNLNFLEKYFHDIYMRVEELSLNFNNQTIDPKYSLEFRDNYFDVLNIGDNSWYYGSNSYDDADERTLNTNFTKDGSLDLLRKGFGSKLAKGGSNLEHINPIIDYINDSVELDNIEFDKIYKFVFIGVGLGVHIQGINRKVNPFTTLIMEPELEIFRLSLFVTDYTEFQTGNRKLFLSIEDDKFSRTAAISGFYGYHNYMNYNIKHHLLVESDRYLFDELVDFFSTHTVASFPYTSTMENIFRTQSFMKSGYRFLNRESVGEEKILENKKVLIVAAGPSLDEYIDWIALNQDKFIIVAVDVIVRKLEKHNIVPDIVFSIDQSPLCAKYLECDNKHFLDNSAIIFLSQQHEDVLKVVEKNHIYFSQSISLVSRLGYLGSVTNVGAFSLMMSIHLGANELYIIGSDAAFHQETGSKYAIDSSYSQSQSIENLGKNDNMVSAFDVLEVKGNLLPIVKTNRSLLTFKESFEGIVHILSGYYEFELFNLSNGVFMEMFTPMTKDEISVKMVDFELKNHKIIENLDSVSCVLELDEILFESDKNKILNIIKRVKKYQKITVKNRQEFLETKLEIMVWILEQSKEINLVVFSNIFLMFTEFSDIYINFVLNLKQDNLCDGKHLMKLKDSWANGVIAVLKDFQKVA